jgi:hypothetical protein
MMQNSPPRLRDPFGTIELARAKLPTAAAKRE